MNEQEPNRHQEEEPSSFDENDLREISEAMDEIMRELGEHTGEYRRMLNELLVKRSSTIEDFTVRPRNTETRNKMLETNARSKEAFVMYLQALLARNTPPADASTLLSFVFKKASSSQSWLEIAENGETMEYDIARVKSYMESWLSELGGEEAMQAIEDLFDELFWQRPRKYAPPVD